MSVMEAPRTRRTKPPQQRAPEPVADEPGDPRLWEIFQNLDLGEGVKVEYIQDTIVVRGAPRLWHEDVVMWLADQFRESCHARGLKRAAAAGLEPLPAPAKSIRPDFLIFDPGSLRLDEDDLTPSHVRLVAEVVSAGSIDADRTQKPLSCARAGIPLYLCVDRFAAAAVNLFSGPGPDGYQHQESLPFGHDGGKLAVPEPFGMVLDLTTLPMP
jgi:Uma2 family endonuclease